MYVCVCVAWLLFYSNWAACVCAQQCPGLASLMRLRNKRIEWNLWAAQQIAAALFSATLVRGVTSARARTWMRGAGETRTWRRPSCALACALNPHTCALANWLDEKIVIIIITDNRSNNTDNVDAADKLTLSRPLPSLSFAI